MRVTRILTYTWLLELDPVHLEVFLLRMLAKAEIQAAKKTIQEALREDPDNERLRLALAELEEIEESLAG